SLAGQDAKDPQVAMAADGTATATWVRNDGINDTVEAATRPAAGVFGFPVRLSAPGTPVVSQAAVPQVAIGPLGAATAVWRRNNGVHDIIQSISTALPALSLGVAKAGTGEGTITSDPAGIDCGLVCAGTLAAYSEVTLTATPDTGSTLADWSGACSGAEGNSCELTMDEAKNAVARFEVAIQPPAGEAELKINRFRPKKPKVKRGRTVKIKVTGKNGGEAASTGAELCLKIGGKARKAVKAVGKDCRSLGTMPSGKAKTRTFKVKAKKLARKGASYRLSFRLSGDGTSAAEESVKLRIRK
ncbi:MAG: hypothetical protein KDB62_10005, partial [Solirubrobacterales bacterium]|nr:hypothetical protein [Solirubrobacterales bacterium]